MVSSRGHLFIQSLVAVVGCDDTISDCNVTFFLLTAQYDVHMAPTLPRHTYVPSTSDVYRVTVAALRLPAGKFNPIFSNFSRRTRPPFLDLALKADKQ